jgi:hypothetical protein
MEPKTSSLFLRMGRVRKGTWSLHQRLSQLAITSRLSYSTSPPDKPGCPDVSHHECYRCPKDLQAPGVNVLLGIALALIMPVSFLAEDLLYRDWADCPARLAVQ